MRKDGHQTMPFKQEALDFIERQVSLGRSLKQVLKNVEISKSTYFSWKNQLETSGREDTSNLPGSRAHPLKVTPGEIERVVETKNEHMHMRHRQIQGVMQNRGLFLSPTTVFKILKAKGLVEPYERREAPWKSPRYEVSKRNMMWGTDWTKFKVNHMTWHLLTLIDFFSRVIIAWDIVPSVNSSHIRALYAKGLRREGLEKAAIKPKLRADQGSPNTAWVTKDFFKQFETDMLSLARIRRPTDNALTERFYQTIKQEEIYLVGSYPDETAARQEISRYIERYNTERPHQGIWNFIPAYVHAVNNKSLILAELEALKFQAKRRRREYWALRETIDFQKKLIAELRAQGAELDDTSKSSI
jgi:transposase InsO family protein